MQIECDQGGNFRSGQLCTEIFVSNSKTPHANKRLENCLKLQMLYQMSWRKWVLECFVSILSGFWYTKWEKKKTHLQLYVWKCIVVRRERKTHKNWAPKSSTTTTTTTENDQIVTSGPFSCFTLQFNAQFLSHITIVELHNCRNATRNGM